MKKPPVLLREAAIVYRCPFCRKSWRRQVKRIANRHLVHCFKRPDRVPFLGEILHAPDDTSGGVKIWDGHGWRQVPDEVPSEWDSGAWALRLRMFEDFDRAFARLAGPPDEGPLRINDERLIRLVHGREP